MNVPETVVRDLLAEVYYRGEDVPRIVEHELRFRLERHARPTRNSRPARAAVLSMDKFISWLEKSRFGEVWQRNEVLTLVRDARDVLERHANEYEPVFRDRALEIVC